MRAKTIPFVLLSLALSLLFPALPGPLNPASLPTVAAQGPPNPLVCYAVADGGDRLHSMNRTTGVDTAAPNALSVDSVEAIELSLDASTLWGIHDNGTTGILGTIDQVSGLWTAVGAYGSGSHPVLGTRNLADGDGLAIDGRTNRLWALEQTGGTRNNAVFLLNPDGTLVNDTFGPGADYAIVDLNATESLAPCFPGGPTCTPGVNCPNTIDDIAMHPETGEFYMIVNDIVDTTVDWVARLNLDGLDPANSPGYNPSTGYISACLVGIITNGPDDVTDMEGFGVFNDGTFYGTTGSESLITAQRQSMWQIDVTTAQATLVGTFQTNTDYEGVACLTAGANTMTGAVFCEPPGSSDGVFNTGDTAQPNATLRLYEDNGTPGVLDPADALLQTTTSDSGGGYTFQIGGRGSFLIEMDGAIIPAGSVYTTASLSSAAFSSFNTTDGGNDFGFTCQAVTTADLSITKGDSPDPVTPDGTITYSIVVSNVGGAAATNATMSDPLPAGTTFVALTEAPGWSCTAPAVGSGGAVSCTAPTVDVGGSHTFTLTVAVPAGYAGPNPIPNTATTGADNDSNPANNSASTTTALQTVTAADLSITKGDSPDPVTPDGTITYSIVVSNVGGAAATNATMSDPLPAGTTFVALSEPGGWSCTAPAVGSGGTVNCTNPAAAPGGPYPFTIIVSVPADYSGPNPIPNTATVGAANDSNAANNRASVTTALPAPPPPPVTPGAPGAPVTPGTETPGDVELLDPALSKAGILERGGLGFLGEQITWVITATNPNSVPLSSVVVSDTLRSDLRVDDASSALGSASISGQTVTFSLGTLAPGQSVRMEIVTTIISGPNMPIGNTASLTADGVERVTAYAEVFGFPTRLPATGYPPGS